MAATLRPLSEALQGKPSETEATKVIATYAAIPAAAAGIFGGTAFVPTAANSGVLLASAAGGAVAAAAVVVLVIHGDYHVFGFRSVSCIGSAVMGAIVGSCLLFLLAPRVSWPAWPWWSALGALVGAVAGAVLGWSIRPKPAPGGEKSNRYPGYC